MTQRFEAFLEIEFRFATDSEQAQAYKNELLYKMQEKEKELRASGATDEDVIFDACVASLGNFGDRIAQLPKVSKAKVHINKLLNFVIYSLIYTLVVVGVFLAISFTKTLLWSQSWIILSSGFLGGIVVISAYVFVVLLFRKKYNLARPFLHTAIILSTVIAYLCYSVFTPNAWGNSWFIFLIMSILSTGVECIYDFLTDSKWANISLMVFVPVSFSIVYVMLSIAGMLSWHPYWFIPAVAIAFDIVLALVLLKKKLK